MAQYLHWSDHVLDQSELEEILEELSEEALNAGVITGDFAGVPGAGDGPDPAQHSGHDRRLLWSPRKRGGRSHADPASPWWYLRQIYWRPFRVQPQRRPAPGGESLRAEAARRGVTVYQVRKERQARQGITGQAAVRSLQAYRARLLTQLYNAPETVFGVDPLDVEIKQGRGDMKYPFLYIFEYSPPAGYLEADTIELED